MVMVNIYNQVNTKLQDKYCIYRKKFRTTFKRRCVKHRDKTELILGGQLCLRNEKSASPKNMGKAITLVPWEQQYFLATYFLFFNIKS